MKLDTSTQRNLCRALLCGGVLMASLPAAHAGLVDSLFGKSDAKASGTESKASRGQREWRIGEFSSIQLVAREPGAMANQQPVRLQADALREQLALVQRGDKQPLFAKDELSELTPPLVDAIGHAGANDDVVLVSSSRRDGGFLAKPTAVTARLFVQGDGLQLVVHDTRFDFYDDYRGTHSAPRFVYGSRAAPSGAAIASSGATNRRADWLSIPLQVAQVDAPMAAPVAAPVPAVQTPMAPPATQSPAPARAPADAVGGGDAERRLETLKRLRDKGLISEDEYQLKRKEILQQL